MLYNAIVKIDVSIVLWLFWWYIGMMIILNLVFLIMLLIYNYIIIKNYNNGIKLNWIYGYYFAITKGTIDTILQLLIIWCN
jgi:hypothetical protein